MGVRDDAPVFNHLRLRGWRVAVPLAGRATFGVASATEGHLVERLLGPSRATGGRRLCDGRLQLDSQPIPHHRRSRNQTDAEGHRSDSVEGGMKPREPGAAIAVAVSEPAVCCEVPLGLMLGVSHRSVRVHPRARSVNIDWAPNFTAVRSGRVLLHRAMQSANRGVARCRLVAVMSLPSALSYPAAVSAGTRGLGVNIANRTRGDQANVVAALRVRSSSGGGGSRCSRVAESLRCECDASAVAAAGCCR